VALVVQAEAGAERKKRGKNREEMKKKLDFVTTTKTELF